MTKKITKRERFNQLLEIAEVKANADLVDFINHEIELVERKNGSRKPTKTQLENEGIKDAIVEIMGKEPNRMFTVTEMCKMLSDIGDFTPQKISALMRALVLDGKVERVQDKRKTYFKYVD